MANFLGAHRIVAFLNMTGCRDTYDLNNVLAIYLQPAKVKLTPRLNLFEAAVDQFQDKEDVKGFNYMITDTMFNNMLTMKGEVTSVASALTGWL